MKKFKTLPLLNKAIGNSIRELRKERKWTQAVLAQNCEFSIVYVSQIETAVRGASVSSLLIFAKAFALSGSELMARIERERQRLLEQSLVKTKGPRKA